MIVYDDIETSEKVKVYDKGVDVRNGAAIGNGNGNGAEARYKLLVSYRSGDMLAPALSPKEALEVETDHFLDCVRNGAEPWTGGEARFRVVQVLEAAQQSLEQESAKVRLWARCPPTTVSRRRARTDRARSRCWSAFFRGGRGSCSC